MKLLASVAGLLAVSMATLSLLPSTASAAQADRLDIQVVDGQISMYAEAVGLGRLLSMFDRATGTESTVPPELENRNVSVQFLGLDRAEAVRKIFEGLPLDYVVLEAERIVVTAVSGTAAPGSGPIPVSNPVQTPAQAQPFAGVQPPVAAANPFQSPGVNPGVPAQGGNGSAPAQPAIIQTPFGPLVNPRANAQPAAPLAGPGQGFPFGGGAGAVVPPGATGGRAVFPNTPVRPAAGALPGAGQPSIFGNTAPPMLDPDNSQPVSPDRSQP